MKHRTFTIAFAWYSTLAPAGAGAQIIAGRVLEAGSDRPLPAARVSLTSDGSALVQLDTNHFGFFRFALPQSGDYAVRVEQLGYVTASTEPIPVRRDETVEIAIRMSVSAVRLAPLMVVERRRTMPRTEFERRMESGRQMGRGWFITRDELEQAPSPSVTGVLARVPHVGTVRDPTGKAHPVILSRGGCTPTLYMNGARFTLAAGEGIDDMILPHELEGVELQQFHGAAVGAAGLRRDCVLDTCRPANTEPSLAFHRWGRRSNWYGGFPGAVLTARCPRKGDK